MYALIVIASFLLMECFTWFAHRYIMHGSLWVLHRDHHQPRQTIFEKNDLFFLIFATPAIILMWFGTQNENSLWMFFIGTGITLYGFAYFVVHDIIIHQRFKIFTRWNNFYVRAIRKAHKVHHKHLGKEHGECFGMLWVPMKYFREALRVQS